MERTPRPVSFLVALLLFAASPLIAQSDQERSELYAYSVVLRSKVESTDLYKRKLDLLYSSHIEKWSSSLLNDRMNSLSQSDQGLTSLLSAASFIPGRVGKFAKTLKYIDYGKNQLEKRTGNQSKGLISWENDTEDIAKRVFSFAQKDPEFAAIVNQYLAKEIGDVKGSSKELLNAYPILKNRVLLEELQKELVNHSYAEKELYELIKTDSEMLTYLTQNQISESEYQKKLQTIEEYNIYGHLLSKIVGLRDPTLANKISTFNNAYSKFATISEKLNYDKISAAAASANYVIISIEVLESLSGEISADAQIMKALQQIQQLIYEQTEILLEKLGNIEDQIRELMYMVNETYFEVLSNRELLVNMNTRLDEIENRIYVGNNVLYYAIRDGINRELIETIARANSHKDVFKPGSYIMAKEEFNQAIVSLYTYATVHLEDRLSNTGNTKSYDEQVLFEELSNTPIIYNLPYIGNALGIYTSGKFSKLESDLSTWIIATDAIIELVGDWPEFQKFRPEFIEKIILKGNEIRSFIESCSYSNNPQAYIDITNRLATLGNRLNLILLSDFEQDLQEDIRRVNLIDDTLLMRTVNGLDTIPTFDSISVLFKNSFLKNLKINVKSNYTWKDTVVDADSLISRDLIPEFLKLAYHLGLISFEIHQDIFYVGGVRKEQKYNLIISVVEKKTKKSYVILQGNYAYKSPPPSGVVVASIPDYAKPPTPTEVAHGNISFLWKGEYIVEVDSNIMMLKKTFSGAIDKYFEKIYKASLERSFSQNVDCKNTYLEILGFNELLFKLMELGQQRELSTDNAINSLMFSQANPAEVDYSHILSGISFKEQSAAFLPWNRSIVEYLSSKAVKSEFMCPFSKLDILLSQCETLLLKIQEGNVFNNIFSRERMISQK